MILNDITFYNDDFEKETADIIIENGKIKSIIKKDYKDSNIFAIPGFVDIHIHGAMGGDFSDAKKESTEKISKYLAENGVTSFCGTTMTLGNSTLKEIISSAKEYKKNEKYSRLVGINLEGPFISKAKKGAQNEDFIRNGTTAEFEELFSLSNGLIKLITIAPEAFSSDEFISKVSKKCVVSIGHSNANGKECEKAFSLGANHITHLFNAMTPMNHREAGIVGTALDNENVFCEIICDGGHIIPPVLRNAFKILGENRACIISDSMRAAGLGAGKFELGGQEVFAQKNGKYAVLSNGTIAASITNVYNEFRNLVDFGIDFKTALKSATINPAKSIGLENKIGSIKVGKYADFVFLDKELSIKSVFIDGEKII